MKLPVSALALVMASGCAILTVSPDQLQPGTPDSVTFKTTGKPTYDEVWRAAMHAMGNGMVIVESHKPSGTIKSRVGAAPTGKVVAFFIRPTTPTAPEYTVELVSKTPQGLGQPERRLGEPSVVEDFRAALRAR